MDENQIGAIVVDCAVKLHKDLGPGLLESVYESILAGKLSSRGLNVEKQKPIRILYEGVEYQESFRADIVINNLVILELKAVENVLPVHKKQLQTYLKLTGCKLGFLLNFNELLMKDGITRCVNNL